jgi:hypothetical protein
MIADYSLSDLCHPFGNTDAVLHRYFARMPSHQSMFRFFGIHSERLSDGRVHRGLRMRDK